MATLPDWEIVRLRFLAQCRITTAIRLVAEAQAMLTALDLDPTTRQPDRLGAVQAIRLSLLDLKTSLQEER